MAATKREWLVRYDEMLNGVSEKSLAALDEALAAFDFGADPYEVRSGLIRIMMPLCGGSTTTASTVAARFYDGLREKKLGERLGATPDSGREPEATARAVHAFVSSWEKDRDDERLKRALRQRLDYEVRKSANMTIQRNAERDPGSSRYARNFAGNQKARAYEERKAARRGRYRAGRDTGVRYARVPMGLETCEFCIMLASRGFVYHDEELAGHAHAHCDCRVIPDFEGKASSIEGYDPGYYLDCYKHPDEHPEIRDAINARRRELRAERKRAGSGDSLVKWSNDAVAAIQSMEDLKSYIESKFETHVDESFMRISLDVAKGEVAGMEAALKAYGQGRVTGVFCLSSKVNDGEYHRIKGNIYLSPNPSDPYLTGFHEMVHAIDAQRSQNMPQFLKTDGAAAYSLYSESVLASALSGLKWRRNSKAYKDAVLSICSYDLSIYNRIIDKPFEIIAWSLEREAAGRSSKLTSAIARLFGGSDV